MTTNLSKTLLGSTSKAVLLAAAIGAAGFFVAPAANADTISIGLGINGGAVTNEGSAPTTFGIIGVSFGGYTLNNVSGIANPGVTLPTLLNSNSINASSAGTANVLDVYVTDSGITTPTGIQGFISSFTQNTITAGWSSTLLTLISPADALFTGSLLSTATFTSISTAVDTATANAGAGPYSVTAEYQISSHNLVGSSNATINENVVPEPASLAIFGTALVGLGAARRRRNKKQA
jgi:hypothetical protein